MHSYVVNIFAFRSHVFCILNKLNQNIVHSLAACVQCTACCIKYANDVCVVCISFDYFLNHMWNKKTSHCQGATKGGTMESSECISNADDEKRNEYRVNGRGRGRRTCVQMNPIEIELQLVPNVAFFMVSCKAAANTLACVKRENGGRASEDGIQYSKHAVCLCLAVSFIN